MLTNPSSVSVGLVFMGYRASSAAWKPLSGKKQTDWLFIWVTQWTRAGTCAASNPRVCDTLTSEMAMYSKGRVFGSLPLSWFYVPPKADKRGKLAQWKAGIGVFKKRLHQPTDNYESCHSTALMYNVHRHGILLHLHFSFLFPVDFDRINLPHQWGNPLCCVELWVDWAQRHWVGSRARSALQLCDGVEHGGEWEQDKLTGGKSPSLMGLTQQQTGTSALDWLKCNPGG